MALMFLPSMQGDYEMICEGAAEWEGQSAWVVHFRQRSDKPSRTFSFQLGNDLFHAGLKGHAWIGADSGQVLHLETGLMEGIPAAKVVEWYLAADYVPVQFQTPHVQLWLPQTADSYLDFGEHRTLIFHTFTNFMLFSIQTEQKIQKPKQP